MSGSTACWAHRSLLPTPEPGRAAQILRRPDPILDGASLLDVMLRDDLPGLARARAHLVAQV